MHARSGWTVYMALLAFTSIAVTTTARAAEPLAPAAALTIPFTLTKPAGDGPFPAVVILHDCSGLGPKSGGAPWRWATRLVAKGYVTIWPDSFVTRGHPDGVCTDPSEPIVTSRQRAEDAYAALAYISAQPYVDGKRIAVMGGSHGGSATLATIAASRANASQSHADFAAAIALYPACDRQFGDWSVTRDTPPGSPITAYNGVFKPLAPLLILSGALDDWTPAAPCLELATRAKAAGHPVDIVVYPNAHHSFDSRSPLRFVAERVNSHVVGGRGATTGGNAEAWADAIAQVDKFLATHLAQSAGKAP